VTAGKRNAEWTFWAPSREVTIKRAPRSISQKWRCDSHVPCVPLTGWETCRGHCATKTERLNFYKSFHVFLLADKLCFEIWTLWCREAYWGDVTRSVLEVRASDLCPIRRDSVMSVIASSTMGSTTMGIVWFRVACVSGNNGKKVKLSLCLIT
jgi:hypothetical protein